MSDPDRFLTNPPAPHSDEHTYQVLDDALTALAGHRRLNLGDEHVLIHLLASLIEQAERWLPHEVQTARANGTGWDTIAVLLGTSPQEARLRFDPDSPVADSRWPYDYDP